jgi:hypothetical protein
MRQDAEISIRGIFIVFSSRPSTLTQNPLDNCSCHHLEVWFVTSSIDCGEHRVFVRPELIMEDPLIRNVEITRRVVIYAQHRID